MLIGHYAPALALSRIRPSVRLWQLFLATQLVDILWSLFVVAGLEHARLVPGFTASNDLDLWDMPYSHSLVATLVWSTLALLAWRLARDTSTRTGDAVVIALAVASHFVADLIVHDHDLPLIAGQGTKLGFGLWRDRGLAVTVETSLFAVAGLWWWWPRRSSPGARRALAWLVVMTALAAASFFSPSPPSPRALALTGLALHVSCAAFAWWAERSSSRASDHAAAARRTDRAAAATDL